RLGDKDVIKLADVDRSMVDARLDAMQKALFERALAFRDANIVRLDTWEQVKSFFASSRGFVRCRFNPDREIEARIKEETRATVRCIPFDQPGGTAPCMYTGKPADREVIFGIGY
ncbi:MAG TPA: proline--tRNA ligase, partial [Myxococcota bacterium]|nr:proline--tRNA ligase [Myxococcota bacterium]